MKLTSLIYLLLPIFINVNAQAQAIDLSEVDINEIKSVLTPEELEAYIGASPSLDESTELEPYELFLEETLVEEEKIIDEVLIEKFGYSFFSKIPTSTSAVGDLPLPNDYKISIRDEFTVILSGSKERIFDLSVNLDGTILFPEIGSISVVGNSLKEVKNKLTNIVDQAFVGVNVDISIKNLSAKKITIVGAVEYPGTYLVNPFSTISSALAYSGGISEVGTLRDIKLIRNNGETFNFDLYDLLIYGNRNSDITIEAGDTILIGAASQFTQIDGAVNRPAIYEILETDTLEDIIFYSLGFKQNANQQKVSLNILDFDNSKTLQKEVTDKSMSLRDVISVEVFEYLSKEQKNVYVDGAVAKKGYYAIDDNKTLEDLISKLDFIDVYPWYAVLEQFDEQSLVRTSHSFSLKDPETFKDIEIKQNSRVFFANRDLLDFEDNISAISRSSLDDFALNIIHPKGEYTLPVIGKFSILSFIDFIGIDMSSTLDEATYLSPLSDNLVVGNYKDMNFNAERFHSVSFKEMASNVIRVTVSGAVKYPGVYSLSSGFTINDLYGLVGGFKDNAFLDGIVLKRLEVADRQAKALEEARRKLADAMFAYSQIDGGQSVDMDLMESLATFEIDAEDLGRVAGDFTPGSDAISDTFLFEGDTIFIPYESNSFSVIGEVLNPNNIILEGRISVRDAIERAGGFSEFADTRRIYVIKSNGLVEKVSKSVFSGANNIEPGDTVVIPRKLDYGPARLMSLILPYTQLISDLSFSAAALNNLNN